MTGLLFLLLFIVLIAPLALGIVFSKLAFAKLFFSIMLFLTFQILIGVYEVDNISQNAMIYITLTNWITLLYLCLEIKFGLYRRIVRNADYSLNAKGARQGFTSLILAIGALFFLIESMGGISSLLKSWLIIRSEMSSNVSSRLAANILFFMSASTLLIARLRGSSTYLIILIALLLLSFCLLIRVKIFFIPIVIALFIPLNQSVNLRRLFSFSVFFVLAYLLIMIFRWMGDLEGATLERGLEVGVNVLNAGVEREAYHQFISVFNYYEANKNVYFASVSRYLLIAFDRVVGADFAPDNPMYMYSTISNGMFYEAGGSAHPTIFGDSFAQAGWLGIFWPLIVCFTLTTLFLGSKNLFSQAMSSLLLYFSMILIVRGSSFYGFLYLTPVLILVFWNLLSQLSKYRGLASVTGFPQQS
ncbi:hypothetical protein N8946_04115 [Pseudomonadales bacterium]|nr:hypothetical protein [Pseudomonadales bacterium]MDA7771923.1 hypothetical protein [Pseudomonadales bacterium]